MSSVVLSGQLIVKRTDQYAGNHRIHGTVRLEATPADTRRVLLLDKRNFHVIAQTFTAQEGTYAFEHIASGTFLVAGQDLQTNFHPDIVRVDSEPMP
ncbi:hypothetical protein Nhal_1012 [Nitrosococcus halophilus Nc 4]|uniref:Carboxypeptidase regulatory-like domain-containing protein n=1 Tax=Nitrosococcus halophilus (strain Nc4) TaxID=472759 RepID=D5BYX2_NITHN|nr:hypothetical protein [Nitrosococcus halophilus]ADE14185.1 hypothetical protein Nhal_1012 [Nitrosococcus halophilus Nc 4]